MDANTWTLIGQFGFPMVVALYLLVRVDNTIKALSDVITKNTAVLSQMANKEGVRVE